MSVLKNQIKLKTGKHWQCEECILCSEFYIPSGCRIVDSQMIKEHLVRLDQFLKEVKLAFLSDLSSSENVMSFDALEAWSQSELLNEHRLAEAFVVSTLADLVFFKQHIRLNQLTYPAQAFQSLKEAQSWLKIINENQPPPYPQVGYTRK